MNISKIQLQGVLPLVFAKDENDAPIRKSEVWLKDIMFVKGSYYKIEAESGAGKSSLCSFIYGNREDYSGKILFDDVNVRSISIEGWCLIRRQSLSILPQDLRLFPELTAMENIMIKNRLTDYCSEKEICEMLSHLEIEHKAESPVGRLSIGQQQRVAIARALCQPFSFLILDEPVSHLDERNNKLAADLILEHAKKQGAAIITTSVGNPLLLDTPATSVKL